ncbi:retinitis pigmentosa 9 protein [Denticeps clupeoides]|uniref:RP9 protein n=1 Tax=Denticeps clupeoides TaxID=299321 RepID=A0AAY4EMC3_9TELE|nr:retinitis pigmentosa 9 protein [Denticeps clupeoides]
MSHRKRSGEQEDRRERKKRREAERDDGGKDRVQTKKLIHEVKKLKHVESFYEQPPPGLIKEHDEKPEDCIPNDPGNEGARDFLAHAPTKGLWMPLGKEVKVMQCWRCKRYGHRTGDRECPFFIKGNQKLEQFRVAHEDPMYDLIRENKRNEKETRIQQLQQLLQDTTSSDSESSSSSPSDSSRGQGRKKKRKDKKKDKRKHKKKKKKKKHSKSKASGCSE